MAIGDSKSKPPEAHIQALRKFVFLFNLHNAYSQKSNPAAEPHSSLQGYCTVRPRKGAGQSSMWERDRERGAGAGLFSVLHDGCSMLNNTQNVCDKQNLMTSSYFVTSPYHLSQELNLAAAVAQCSILE